MDFNPKFRDDFVEDFSKSILPDSKILDVSSGAKPYRKLFGKNYISHEFEGNKNIIDTFREEKIKEQHDIYSPIDKIPLESESIDIILCTEVFEHIPEPIAAMNEFVRLCKKGGKILITAPFTSGIHQEPHHFYSGFSPFFYKYLKEKFNLKIIKFKSQGDSYLLYYQEFSRMWHYVRDIDHIRKKLLYIRQQNINEIEKYNSPENMLKIDDTNRFSIGYCVLYEKL